MVSLSNHERTALGQACLELAEKLRANELSATNRPRGLLDRPRSTSAEEFETESRYPLIGRPPRSAGFNRQRSVDGYWVSKGFCNSTPSSLKSRTFLVTTVSLCTMAVAAIMASSVLVSDLWCMSFAHCLKVGASMGSTP